MILKGNGNSEIWKIDSKMTMSTHYWWIQTKISRQLKGMRTFVDQFHDPCVTPFRSRSSVHYKIWPLQILIFDRYCIFKFEFWPLDFQILNFVRKFFYFISWVLTPKTWGSNYHFWIRCDLLKLTSATGVFSSCPSNQRDQTRSKNNQNTIHSGGDYSTT